MQSYFDLQCQIMTFSDTYHIKKELILFLGFKCCLIFSGLCSRAAFTEGLTLLAFIKHISNAPTKFIAYTFSSSKKQKIHTVLEL